VSENFSALKDQSESFSAKNEKNCPKVFPPKVFGLNVLIIYINIFYNVDCIGEESAVSQYDLFNDIGILTVYVSVQKYKARCR